MSPATGPFESPVSQDAASLPDGLYTIGRVAVEQYCAAPKNSDVRFPLDTSASPAAY